MPRDQEQDTHVQLLREACEAGLTINRRKDVRRELLWLFHDRLFSGWIPPNHVMIFWTFGKAAQTKVQIEREHEGERVTYA
jgi:hypothetical protein